MQVRIFRRRCAKAVSMASAAMIGVMVSAGGTFASENTVTKLSPVGIDRSAPRWAQKNIYIGTPSIHESIMEELTRGEPHNADAERHGQHRPEPESFGSPGRRPTSMLWPVNKYLPYLGYSYVA